MVKLSDLSINFVLKPCLRADFKAKMAKIEYLKKNIIFGKSFCILAVVLAVCVYQGVGKGNRGVEKGIKVD